MSFKDCIAEQLKKNNELADKLTAGKRQKKLQGILDQYDKLVTDGKAKGLSDTAAEAEAATRIQKQAEYEKAAKEKMMVANAKAQKRIAENLEQYRDRKGQIDPGAALQATLESDGRGAFSNYAIRYDVIKAQYFSQLDRFIGKYSPKKAGLVKPVEGLGNIVRELYGEATGDKGAKELADSLANVFEMARVRANEAGANIPKKERWAFPQRHDRSAVIRAGMDKWVAMVKDRVDWNRMMHPDTGDAVPLQDRELVLQRIYNAIKTDGASELVASDTAAKRALATRMHQHRFLEFNTAQDFLEYHKIFGTGTIFDAAINYLEDMARHTAMMEIYGANPEATKRFAIMKAREIAGQYDAKNPDSKSLMVDKVSKQEGAFNDMWDLATGANGSAYDDGWAAMFGTVRNVLSANLLGSTVLLALPQDAMMAKFALKFNGLSGAKLLRRYIGMMNPLDNTDRQFAQRSMIISEAAISQAFAQQRMVGEIYGSNISKRFTDVMMRVQLLSPHTDWIRMAFGMEFMGNLADLSGRTFEELDEAIKNALKRYAITPKMWDEFRSGKITEHKGAKFLRPVDAENPEIRDKFMEMILTEREYGIPTATLKARAFLTSSTRPGTLVGEIARSFAMFKNYPVTMQLLHGRRAISEATAGGRAKYIAKLGISLVLMGALGVQMRQIAQGKDPMNMNPEEDGGLQFWGSAIMASGGMGIMGDFLFSNTNRYGQGIEETIAGAPISFLGDVGKLTIGNALDAAQGKEVGLAGDVVQFGSRYAPKPFYLRLALQRMFWDSLLEEVDPKAASRFRRQVSTTRKDFGQEFWWSPGESSPERAPELSAAFE